MKQIQAAAPVRASRTGTIILLLFPQVLATLVLASHKLFGNLHTFFTVCEANKIRFIRHIRFIRVPILAVDPQAKSFKNHPINTYGASAALVRASRTGTIILLLFPQVLATQVRALRKLFGNLHSFFTVCEANKIRIIRRIRIIRVPILPVNPHAKSFKNFPINIYSASRKRSIPLFFIMLFMSITQATNAQQSTDIFESPNAKFTRLFRFSLGNANRMQLELTSINDLSFVKNFDSIIREVAYNLDPLKDSIPSQIYARRIDYIADTSEIKKFRISKTLPARTAYAVRNGKAAILKTEQDTLVITGVVPINTKDKSSPHNTYIHYYRITFFLNDLNDLEIYMDGQLNTKFITLQQNVNTTWYLAKDGKLHLQKSPDISALQARGHIGTSERIAFLLSMQAQNYKDYFVPSMSVSVMFSTNNGFIRKDLILGWEEHFLFARDDKNKRTTFPNGFITFSYERQLTGSPDKASWLFSSYNIGYLLSQKGDFYHKNTFKAGLGKLYLFKRSLYIQPALYFHGLFKAVTPSLRLAVRF